MCGKNEYQECVSYNDFAAICNVSETNGVVTLSYNSSTKVGINLNLFALSGSKTYIFKFGSGATNAKIAGNGNTYGNVKIVVEKRTTAFNLVLDSVVLSNRDTVIVSEAQTLNLGLYGSTCQIMSTKASDGGNGASYGAFQVGNGGPGGNGTNGKIAISCSGKLNISCGTEAYIKGGDGGNGAMAIYADQINVAFACGKGKANLNIVGGSGGAGGAGGYGSLLFGLGKTYASGGSGGSSALATNVDIIYE